MTIIAGYDDGTTVAIGCDTLVTELFEFDIGSKLVEYLPDHWVGSSGSPLWHRWARDIKCVPPATEIPDGGRTHEERVADHWIGWAKDRGHGEKSHGQEYQQGALLLANPRGLFLVTADGAVISARGGYVGIGIGGPLAMGALFVGRGMTTSPGEKVKGAVLACIRHTEGCGGQAIVQAVERVPKRPPNARETRTEKHTGVVCLPAPADAAEVDGRILVTLCGHLWPETDEDVIATSTLNRAGVNCPDCLELSADWPAGRAP